MGKKPEGFQDSGERGNEQRTRRIRCLSPVHMVRGVAYSPRIMNTQMDT
jgi:hypothetical protein